VIFAALEQPMTILEMWANAQRDVRPAEYRWRRLFNAAVNDSNELVYSTMGE